MCDHRGWWQLALYSILCAEDEGQKLHRAEQVLDGTCLEHVHLTLRRTMLAHDVRTGPLCIPVGQQLHIQNLCETFRLPKLFKVLRDEVFATGSESLVAEGQLDFRRSKCRWQGGAHKQA
eukprot:CAMPEP_0179157258 /NCGR_PEP_ID=MMETSP0796-20121207/76699_1 /TAXON_ID=73915 /ORGANISM="Pyrodinium bahamense, Strain pbaha01" /LENGTH=119 /DNA_ID=CAMNT_0020858887 /DNA_START=306 /DNA_END=661 /DNA_ORIENTATION=-